MWCLRVTCLRTSRRHTQLRRTIHFLLLMCILGLLLKIPEYLPLISIQKYSRACFGSKEDPDGAGNVIDLSGGQTSMDVIDRLKRLEAVVEDLLHAKATLSLPGVSPHSEAVTVKWKNCVIPQESSYPQCAEKVTWMQINWKTNEKFSLHGVNGTVCSILAYLSQVEHFCPSNISSDWHYLSSYDGPNCIIPEHPDYPECRQKVEWFRYNWKLPAYVGHVDGTVCSFLRFLSEVENFCPSFQTPSINDCIVPRDPNYPECAGKVLWMKKHWRIDPCYAANGVNTTVCSMLTYLSEVENFCPLLPGRVRNITIELPPNLPYPSLSTLSLQDLLGKLSHVEEIRFKWIRSRVTRLFSSWLLSAQKLQKQRRLLNYPRKKIAVFIGLLAEESKFHFGFGAFQGGPLGELVQWSDLISSIYTMGHDLVVSVDVQSFVQSIQGKQSMCPSSTYQLPDVIYTDYIGASLLVKSTGSISILKCRLRIVDSFGTEPPFNDDVSDKLNMRNSWAVLQLHPKQYNTMFPHSPDNTFLGFVVDNLTSDTPKMDIAVVYGKHSSMWMNNRMTALLNIVSKYFQVHATVNLQGTSIELPSYVINHGVLSGPDLFNLLQRAKLFIGTGFPYEGPAPLEAVSAGCIFLNAKFNPPVGRGNHEFFKDKPTFRRLTSQHPYMELFVGYPHVITVDILDLPTVEKSIADIKTMNISSYHPFEFSIEGMLQRINSQLQHQDFCTNKDTWPPLTSSTLIVSKPNESCQDACWKEGLLCEYNHFVFLNVSQMNLPIPCKNFAVSDQYEAPGVDMITSTCFTQSNNIHNSCVASRLNFVRFCPCRDFIRGQVELCRDCL